MRNDDSDKASFTHSTMPGELRRVEVITGTARRRTWSAHEKARIVAESFEPGANVSEVARRHGVNRGQLFTWRRQAMRKRFCRCRGEHADIRSGLHGAVRGTRR